MMKPSQPRRLQAHALVALGMLLLILAHTRWGVGLLAWVAPVPLFAALRGHPGFRFRLAFAGYFAVAWILATAKIVTEPVPTLIAVGYGLPIALVHLPGFWLWDALVRRGRDGLAVLAFGAASALLEWAQAELTPFGVWGATPTSQVGQLALLQLLALVGMPGLSFLMHTAAAALEGVWARRLSPRAATSLAGLLAIIIAWGAWRAEQPIAGPEVRAAAIRTDSTFSGLPIASLTERRRVDATLFERTAAAAAAGATLVSWTEAATLVLPDEEPSMIREASAAAKAHGIELVIAYIMPISEAPLRYENRLRWFSPEGVERLAYLKHHPVPGEPATPGPTPAPTFQTAFGAATGALCYDYDFPALARTHARAGAGLIAIPSSDWRGIDPVHTEMAAMRAIEGGFSILRSTRWGLSGGIDARGRLRGQLSTNETDAPFLLVSLPTIRQPTLYAALGNAVLIPLWAVLAWSVWVLAAGARVLRRSHPSVVGAALTPARQPE
jgi:apolipoprotein N-acyltransferase